MKKRSKKTQSVYRSRDENEEKSNPKPKTQYNTIV